MKRDLIGGSIIVLIGVLLLLDSLALIDISLGILFRTFWPLILVLIGVWIIFSPGRAIKSGPTDQSVFSDDQSINTDSVFLGAFGDIRVAGLENFSGPLDKSLLVGDIVIDLRNSRMNPGEQRIIASVLIGDIDFLIPADCPVSVELSCLAGSVACAGKVVDGFFPRLRHIDDDFPQANSKLSITARTLIGDIKLIKG